METIPQVRSFFPVDSSLHHIDKKNSSQHSSIIALGIGDEAIIRYIKVLAPEKVKITIMHKIPNN